MQSVGSEACRGVWSGGHRVGPITINVVEADDAKLGVGEVHPVPAAALLRDELLEAVGVLQGSEIGVSGQGKGPVGTLDHRAGGTRYRSGMGQSIPKVKRCAHSHPHRERGLSRARNNGQRQALRDNMGADLGVRGPGVRLLQARVFHVELLVLGVDAR